MCTGRGWKAGHEQSAWGPGPQQWCELVNRPTQLQQDPAVMDLFVGSTLDFVCKFCLDFSFPPTLCLCNWWQGSCTHTPTKVPECWNYGTERFGQSVQALSGTCMSCTSMVSSSVQRGFKTIFIWKRFKPFPGILVLLIKKYYYYHCIGNTICGSF